MNELYFGVLDSTAVKNLQFAILTILKFHCMVSKAFENLIDYLNSKALQNFIYHIVMQYKFYCFKF